MPNWQPNWNDVRWNWGAADEAIAALRRMADRLDQSAHERTRVADPAQRQWRGRYRNDFDHYLERLLQEARSRAGECRDAAGQVARASQAAAEEQHRREADRRRWWDEKREEERRERERRERNR